MQRMIFINLPVRDLHASTKFFEQLGFAINPRFSDATAACVVISETICAMLLTHDKFRKFTPNQICNARELTEVLLCLNCASREEVDALVATAVAAGGNLYKHPEDHGFMYGHGFQDLDGHIWELVYMEQEAS